MDEPRFQPIKVKTTNGAKKGLNVEGARPAREKPGSCKLWLPPFKVTTKRPRGATRWGCEACQRVS